MGAVKGFEPRIHPCPGTPGGLDHRCQAAIAAANEVLHGRKAHVGEVRPHSTQPLEGLTQQLLTPLKFLGGNAVPLKRCVGFRREVADGDVQVQPAEIAAALLEHPAGVGDSQHVGVHLTRESDHEVELHPAVSVLHGGADAMQQVLIREALVHDVSQPLGTRFRSKGQA